MNSIGNDPVFRLLAHSPSTCFRKPVLGQTPLTYHLSLPSPSYPHPHHHYHPRLRRPHHPQLSLELWPFSPLDVSFGITGVSKTLKNERVFGFAEPFSPHQTFTIIKEARPGHHLAEPTDKGLDLMEIAERPRSLELLKWYGTDGYISLKQSVIDTLDSYDRFQKQ